MLQGWRFWFGMVLIWLAWNAQAREPLRVAIAEPSSGYAGYIEQFRGALQREAGNTVLVVADVADAQLVLALGDQIFQQNLSASLPVVGVHVSSSLLNAARDGGCQCSGIYREAPLRAQLSLLSQLLPGARRVGVLLGDGSQFSENDFRSPGLLFDIRYISDSRQLAPTLGDLLPGVEVLLALPDVKIYSADTARLILLTSYRHGKPVIGPDDVFVRAGSLASVQPSAEGLVRATIDLLRAVIVGESLPEPRYAPLAVSFNRHVARSYGVGDVDIDRLEKGLEDVRQ